MVDQACDDNERALLGRRLKINAYLHFVESGELVEMRPDLKGLPVIIQVDAKYRPGRKAVEFYRIAGPIVAEAGVSLQLHVPSSDTTARF